MNEDELNEFYETFSEYMISSDHRHLAGSLLGQRNPDFLAIYRNGFVKSCLSALKANYATVQKLLDDATFTEVARLFIHDFSPKKATLVGYGEVFPDFLSRQEYLPDYIADFAKLDQAWLSAINAQDCLVWDVNSVQSMISEGEDLSDLPVALVSSAHIIRCRFSILDIWLSLKQGVMTQPTQLADNVQTVLVWRREGKVVLKALTAEEIAFMTPLLNPSSLTIAAESALQVHPNFDVSNGFSELLQNQLLTLVTEP
jgi:hypothetical protein